MLTQELHPYEDSDNPGLICVSPKQLTYINDCKYGLVWDTYYKKYHRVLSPFPAPHMSLFNQKEKKEYHDRLGRATTTSIGDIERGEGNPHSAPSEYRGILQTLPVYIRLLTTVVSKKSVHTREVVVIRKTLITRMDPYVDIEQKRIIYLVWEIFWGTRDLFSEEVKHGEALSESMLWYPENFLGVGRIPTDIVSVPVAQLGGEE